MTIRQHCQVVPIGVLKSLSPPRWLMSCLGFAFPVSRLLRISGDSNSISKVAKPAMTGKLIWHDRKNPPLGGLLDHRPFQKSEQSRTASGQIMRPPTHEEGYWVSLGYSGIMSERPPFKAAIPSSKVLTCTPFRVASHAVLGRLRHVGADPLGCGNGPGPLHGQWC